MTECSHRNACDKDVSWVCIDKRAYLAAEAMFHYGHSRESVYYDLIEQLNRRRLYSRKKSCREGKVTVVNGLGIIREIVDPRELPFLADDIMTLAIIQVESARSIQAESTR